jgi:hypothetical protein
MILGESSSDLTAAAMPPASPPEADDPDVPEMGPLLRESMTKLSPADVDDFWDKAADTHKAPTEPDMLSYDQAKELGLGPEDES